MSRLTPRSSGNQRCRLDDRPTFPPPPRLGGSAEALAEAEGSTPNIQLPTSKAIGPRAADVPIAEAAMSADLERAANTDLGCAAAMVMRLRKTHGGSQMLRLRHSLNGFCYAHDHAGLCDDRVPFSAKHGCASAIPARDRPLRPDPGSPGFAEPYGHGAAHRRSALAAWWDQLPTSNSQDTFRERSSWKLDVGSWELGIEGALRTPVHPHPRYFGMASLYLALS
jgi:hypothetical protein